MSMFQIDRRRLLGSVGGLVLATSFGGTAFAQAPAEIEVGLIVPLSGIYARPGSVMRMGAELGIEDINAKGGIKALGGAKLKLIQVDAGDSTEKAKNAAQRMVAEYPNMVAATGAYLSSFTLAVTEVTERAHLPVLTLSYSDLITSRGFHYIFQTSATAASQAQQALPVVLDLAKRATGKSPRTVAIVTDNTAASVASVKPMREGLLKQLGVELVVDETYTPPLADATPLVQRIRSTRPDLVFFLPTVISDAKLMLEKLNEFGMGQGRVPLISFGIAIAEPDLLKTMDPTLVEGVMTCVGNWGSKGQEDLILRMKERFNEPWMTQNAISTYGDMWIIKEALEMSGKADREAVAEALRKMNIEGGPARFFPGGRMQFDEAGRRVGAGLTIVQWRNSIPSTVSPANLALAEPFWPKK